MSDKEIRYTDPVLCLVKDGIAFFTTRDLDRQWGDDWDDVPYEHNAGYPYSYHEHHAKDGIEPWEIVTVELKMQNGLKDPTDFNRYSYNTPWSVRDINAGEVPWLCGHRIAICAGTPLSEFKRILTYIEERFYGGNQ